MEKSKASALSQESAHSSAVAQVGEYELGKTIARGAFSKVKMCIHVPTKVTYVAKIVRISVEVEVEVKREISILRRVRHPHVVQLKEILQSSRNYYIILEAVMGGDGCTLMMKKDNQDGLPENHAARLFAQLISGISACHTRGVAHRDLKPENLLLTIDGSLKISDFGLSRMHKESSNTARVNELASTLAGTMAYVAPEVLTGKYDAFLADYWSMGCILYVLLTGRFPFGPAQGRELEAKIRNGSFVPLPLHVSNSARDLCGGLLCVAPKERLTLEQMARHPFVVEYMPRVVATGTSPDLTPTQSYLSKSFGNASTMSSFGKESSISFDVETSFSRSVEAVDAPRGTGDDSMSVAKTRKKLPTPGFPASPDRLGTFAFTSCATPVQNPRLSSSCKEVWPRESSYKEVSGRDPLSISQGCPPHRGEALSEGVSPPRSPFVLSYTTSQVSTPTMPHTPQLKEVIQRTQS